MESTLQQIDTELAGLVDDIQRYNPVEERAERIIRLDAEMVAALAVLRQHYDACRKLEALKAESLRLDKSIEQTLVNLADCRKQLESNPDPEPVRTVSVTEVLNYATKITKFTHKQPGSENALPWPTEDAIRRGMIAQLSSDETKEPEQEVEMEVEVEEPKQVHRTAQQAQAPKKINLDLFDSDDD